MRTKPLLFAKTESPTHIQINFATSAVGSIKCELQGADDKPLDGFTLDDCDEIYGDSVGRAITWKGTSDVSKFADQPIRLRFVMHDADLYALQFAPQTSETAK